jgi:hypothetical protein
MSQSLVPGAIILNSFLDFLFKYGRNGGGAPQRLKSVWWSTAKCRLYFRYHMAWVRSWNTTRQLYNLYILTWTIFYAFYGLLLVNEVFQIDVLLNKETKQWIWKDWSKTKTLYLYKIRRDLGTCWSSFYSALKFKKFGLEYCLNFKEKKLCLL